MFVAISKKENLNLLYLLDIIHILKNNDRKVATLCRLRKCFLVDIKHVIWVFLFNLKKTKLKGIFSFKFTAFIAHISCKVSSNILYTALLLQRGIIKAHLTLCSALRVIQKHVTRLWRVERWKIKKIFLCSII